MAKRKKKIDVQALLKATPVDVLKKLINMCDGHTIFKPEAFADAGLDARLVENYTYTRKSDKRSPKSTLYVNDMPVDELTGIYGLSFLYSVSSAFGVTYPAKNGRGSQAYEIQHAMMEYFKKNASEQAVG